MRVVRLQGCLPALLLLLAVAGALALALAAGTVFFVAAAALALVGGAIRGLARLGRPRGGEPARPSVPGAARDAVVEVEATGRQPPRLPPGA
jgi:hypothetical protein